MSSHMIKKSQDIIDSISYMVSSIVIIWEQKVTKFIMVSFIICANVKSCSIPVANIILYINYISILKSPIYGIHHISRIISKANDHFKAKKKHLTTPNNTS